MVKKVVAVKSPSTGASDLLGHIRNSLSAFHATELAIANCILLDPVQVSRMNISKLAEHSETSVASVVRFSKTVGYKGFPEFRMALVGEVSRMGQVGIDSSELDSGITVEDSPAEIIRKIFGEFVNHLRVRFNEIVISFTPHPKGMIIYIIFVVS